MEPDNKNTGVDDKDKDKSTAAPQFTTEQQDFINKLFDTRFGKINAKHEQEKKDIEARFQAQLEEAKKVTDDKDKSKDKDKDDDVKKQFKSLLDVEKENTKKALEMARQREDEVKSVKGQFKDLEKSIAIRDAASDIGTIEFVDLKMVKQYTENNIVWDDDASTWVVKENGQVKQNNSLQPMSLTEYYKEFASQHPYLVKGTTKSGAGSSESGGGSHSNTGKVTSKADLKNNKDKISFIANFGLEAYEKLPLRN